MLIFKRFAMLFVIEIAIGAKITQKNKSVYYTQNNFFQIANI